MSKLKSDEWPDGELGEQTHHPDLSIGYHSHKAKINLSKRIPLTECDPNHPHNISQSSSYNSTDKQRTGDQKMAVERSYRCLKYSQNGHCIQKHPSSFAYNYQHDHQNHSEINHCNIHYPQDVKQFKDTDFDDHDANSSNTKATKPPYPFTNLYYSPPPTNHKQETLIQPDENKKEYRVSSFPHFSEGLPCEQEHSSAPRNILSQNGLPLFPLITPTPRQNYLFSESIKPRASHLSDSKKRLFSHDMYTYPSPQESNESIPLPFDLPRVDSASASYKRNISSSPNMEEFKSSRYGGDRASTNLYIFQTQKQSPYKIEPDLKSLSSPIISRRSTPNKDISGNPVGYGWETSIISPFKGSYCLMTDENSKKSRPAISTLSPSFSDLKNLPDIGRQLGFFTQTMPDMFPLNSSSTSTNRSTQAKKINEEYSSIFDDIPAAAANINMAGKRRKRRKCTVESCVNRVVQGGLCIMHGAKRKICSYPGCTKHVKMTGKCSAHGPPRKRCSLLDCKKVSVQGGRCVAHGAHMRLCLIDKCKKQVVLSGMCKKHHDEEI